MHLYSLPGAAGECDESDPEIRVAYLANYFIADRLFRDMPAERADPSSKEGSPGVSK